MKRWSLVAILSLSLTAGVLAIAPNALASVVLGQSIAGVKLGDTKAQVRRVLGPPEVAVKDVFLYPPSRGLHIHFRKGNVDAILSLSKKQKTAKGITVGSSRARVRRAYPKAPCTALLGHDWLYCVVTTHFHGRKSFTSFLFETTGAGLNVIEVGYGSGRAPASTSGIYLAGPLSVSPNTDYTYEVEVMSNTSYRGAYVIFYVLDSEQVDKITLTARRPWYGSFTISFRAYQLQSTPFYTPQISVSVVSPATHKVPYAHVVYHAAFPLTTSAAPARIALNVGAPVQVASTVGQIFVVRLSPSGKALLFSEGFPEGGNLLVWRRGVSGLRAVGHGRPYAVSDDGQVIAYSCTELVVCIRRLGARPHRIALPCHRRVETPAVHVSDNMRSVLVSCEGGQSARTFLIRVRRSTSTTTPISTRLSGYSISSDGSTVIVHRAGTSGPIYVYRDGHLRKVASGGVPFGVSRNGRFILRARPASSLPMPQPELLDTQTGRARPLRLAEEPSYVSALIANDGRSVVYDVEGFRHAASSPCPLTVECSTVQVANTGSGEELNLVAAVFPANVYAHDASADGSTLVTTREEHQPGMGFRDQLFIQRISP